jgi:hypothetical protein
VARGSNPTRVLVRGGADGSLRIRSSGAGQAGAALAGRAVDWLWGEKRGGAASLRYRANQVRAINPIGHPDGGDPARPQGTRSAHGEPNNNGNDEADQETEM